MNFILTHNDPLFGSECKLQTKPKAKWSQNGSTLQWQISEIKPRSKIYLNAIFTLPKVGVDVASGLKSKPDIAVKFYINGNSKLSNSGGKLSTGYTKDTSHLATKIEITPAKRDVKNLRTVYKQRLCCRYHLSFSK